MSRVLPSAIRSSGNVPELRRVMGFWDVLLFDIATVLGPRWIAAAAHNGQSSISLWIIAAVLFFVPTALVITELSTRFPHEGGLYVWTKDAFGDFHGFIAGWTYWIYTIFYFPGLLLAERRDGRVCSRRQRRIVNAEPHFSFERVISAARRRRGNEHHWTEYWKVAAECRRRGDVRSCY